MIDHAADPLRERDRAPCAVDVRRQSGDERLRARLQ